MKGFCEDKVLKFITHTHYVYGLINPLTNKIFYVGKGFKWIYKKNYINQEINKRKIKQ